jgi:KDO2-lipid IV(A) lauroyltransferase
MRLLFTRFLLRLGAILPLRLSHALGGAAGRLGARIDNRPRQLTEINLRVCFPELDAAAHQSLVRRSLAEDGKGFMELGAFWLRRRDRVLGLVREIHGLEHLEAGLESGDGVIVAAPHMGAWELLGLWLSTQAPMATLYRPPHDQGFESLLAGHRARFGAAQIAADRRGVKRLIQSLAAGHIVGILPDQQPNAGQGEFAPFFGIQALTMTLLPRLAQRTGAPVVFAWAERLPRARGFAIHINEPWRVDADLDARETAAELNRRVEAVARQCPEQYQWGYKRFAHRPPGEPKIYPRKRRFSGRSARTRRPGSND